MATEAGRGGRGNLVVMGAGSLQGNEKETADKSGIPKMVGRTRRSTVEPR